jgi:hypothetical protein
MQRRSLSEILPKADRDRLAAAWDSTKPAEDLGLLPAAEYRCRIVDGTLSRAKTGTPSYKLTFEIMDGDHVGRHIWHDIWLSEDAMAMAKRDLGRIGITNFNELDRPLPPGILATVKLAVRKGDDGIERNVVRDFRVIALEAAEPNPFAPDAAPGDGSTTDADNSDRRAGRQGGNATS